MEFDITTIWTATGMAAAALVVGYVFGFLQSVVPFLPTSGVFRNWVIAAISAALVVLAALGTGKTLDNPNLVTDALGGVLVFIGIYNAAKNAHGAGEATALRTVTNATAITTAVPDPAAVDDEPPAGDPSLHG